jgi:site-specific recombinase XerD
MNLPKVKAILYGAKSYSDGTHPILIRITFNRERIYKSVGFSVEENAWDELNGLVWEKKPSITKRQEGQLKQEKLKELKSKYGSAFIISNARHVNTVIQDSISEVNSIIQQLHVNDEKIDLKTIKERLNPANIGDRKNSFFVYAKERQDLLFNKGSVGTSRSYDSAINKLKAFLKNKDIRFENFDLKLLQGYEVYMISNGLKTNTIHNNFKILRAVYYAAQKEGLVSVEKNPFFLFKLKLDNQLKKEKLNVEEIIAIERLSLETGSLIWHVRNCFLFSFYCAGIRVSDLLQLKWQNISSADRLEYKMDKTGGYKSIALLPKAKKILECYKAAESFQDDFIFPLLNTEANLENSTILHSQLSAKTTIINKYLKKIAALAKIDKVLSSHIARHSFSDIARKRGASLYDISKLLSHSSIKITEAYLASLDIESQDAAHKGALDF